MFLKKKVIKIPDNCNYLLSFSDSFLLDKKTFVETSKAYETLILLNNVVVGKIPNGFDKSIYERYGTGEKNVTVKIAYLLKLESELMFWGLGNIHVDDERIKETYDIGANGTFAFKIQDYTKFFKHFNSGKNVSFYDVEPIIKQEIVSISATILSNLFSSKERANVFDANTYLLDFVSQIKEKLDDSEVLNNYGLKVTSFNANPIHIKDEHLRLIQRKRNGEVNGTVINENPILDIDINSKIKEIIANELDLSQYNKIFDDINSKIDNLNNKIDSVDLVDELNNTKKDILNELKICNQVNLTNDDFTRIRDSIVAKVENIVNERVQNKSEVNFNELKTSLEQIVWKGLDSLNYDKKITEINTKIDSMMDPNTSPINKSEIESFKSAIIGELRNKNSDLSYQNLASIENSLFEKINKVTNKKIEETFDKMFKKFDDAFETKLKDSIKEFKKYMIDIVEDEKVHDYEKAAYDANKNLTFEELIDRSKTEFDFGVAATRIFMEINAYIIKSENDIWYKNGCFYTTEDKILDCVNAFKNTDYPIKIGKIKTLTDFPLPSRCRFYLCGATVDESIAGFVFWKTLNCFRHPTEKGNLYIKRQLEVFGEDKKEYLRGVHSYFKRIGFIS